jgi:hypothetical protein
VWALASTVARGLAPIARCWPFSLSLNPITRGRSPEITMKATQSVASLVSLKIKVEIYPALRRSSGKCGMCAPCVHMGLDVDANCLFRGRYRATSACKHLRSTLSNMQHLTLVSREALSRIGKIKVCSWKRSRLHGVKGTFQAVHGQQYHDLGQRPCEPFSSATYSTRRDDDLSDDPGRGAVSVGSNDRIFRLFMAAQSLNINLVRSEGIRPNLR